MLKDYLGPSLWIALSLTVSAPHYGLLCLLRFHFLTVFWKASLFNSHKDMGVYLDNLPFP